MRTLTIVPDDDEIRDALIQRLNERIDTSGIDFAADDAPEQVDKVFTTAIEAEGYTASESRMDICMGCGSAFDWNHGHDPIEDYSNDELAEEIIEYRGVKTSGEELMQYLLYRQYCGNLTCITTDLYRRKKRQRAVTRKEQE